MSRGHSACFKHLMADCNCDSSKQMKQLHHSTRIPTKGRINAWKKFLDFLLSNNFRGVRENLLEVTKGTKLEKYCINKIKQKTS